MKGTPGASLSWGSPIQASPIRKLIGCLSKNPYVSYARKRVPQDKVMIFAKPLRLLARRVKEEMGLFIAAASRFNQVRHLYALPQFHHHNGTASGNQRTLRLLYCGITVWRATCNFHYAAIILFITG